MNLQTIIGLEIHVQLKTKSKMFCGCSNDGEHQPPNTTVCEVCLGHPGVLPVPNKEAMEWAMRVGLALNCTINPEQRFDRKHYFYPDLPKAYQISQLDLPIGEQGHLEVRVPMTREQAAENDQGDTVRVGINRLHIEEDAAKNTHTPAEAGKVSKMHVDYNRGGTPLIEIVTEPDIPSPQAAKQFLQELRLIMRYLGVSDADMEKGHLRCDANISLRPEGEDTFYAKTEIKNLNSFKAVERALEYEITRQTKLWEAGTPPDVDATRGWNENTQKTLEQRSKEGSADYRYFPEPDITPLVITSGNNKSQITNNKQIQNSNDSKQADFNLEKIEQLIPELPIARRERLVSELGVGYSDAKIITEDLALADYFEQVMGLFKTWVEEQGEDAWETHQKKAVKLATGWILNKLGGILIDQKKMWSDLEVTSEQFTDFLGFIFASKLNSSAAQTVLQKMVETGKDPESIVQEQGLEQVSDEGELESMVDEVLAQNADAVEKYKNGKTELLQFFMGQVMKASKGKANPGTVIPLLKQKLDN